MEWNGGIAAQVESILNELYNLKSTEKNERGDDHVISSNPQHVIPN